MKVFHILAVLLSLALEAISNAEESAPITLGGEPRGDGDFCIKITGELRGFTGYLHSSVPFTLRQAIEAAGGWGEWAGEIRIYSPAPDIRAGEKLEKRMTVNQYHHTPELQNLPLTTGFHVHIRKPVRPF